MILSSKEPLVSIIIPSYNQGRFIEDTILSILNQTYKNIEIIVCDGKSTDETIKVLKKYDKKIFWLSEKDSGQPNAINKGFSLSSGEVLTFLNSDDVLIDKRAVQKMVSAFIQNSDFDLIYGDFIEIDHNNKFLRAYRRPNFSFGRLLRIGYISQPATFFTKELIAKFKLNEDLHYGLDLELWLKSYKAGFKFKKISLFIAAERLHDDAKGVGQNANQSNEAKKIRMKFGASFSRLHHLLRLFDRGILYFYRIIGSFFIEDLKKNETIKLEYKNPILETISPQSLPEKFI